jgi:hypothetical protein
VQRRWSLLKILKTIVLQIRGGKAASRLGQQQLMGEHASDPGDLDPNQPGREGIGNVARLFGGDHPSDLPGVLCPPDSQDPLCQ